MSKPLMYKDRTVKRSNYLFMSYSHEDSQILYPLFSKLYDMGADYWYDADLRSGDDWKKKVEQVTSILQTVDTNVGHVFFVSANYMMSEACEYEMRLFLENNAKLDDSKKKASLVVMLVGENTAAQSTIEETLQMEATAKAVTLQCPKKIDVIVRMKKLLEEINNAGNRIYITMPYGPINEDSVEKIYKFFTENSCCSRVSQTLESLARDGKISIDVDAANCGKTHFFVNLGKTEDGDDFKWTIYNCDSRKLYLIANGYSFGACCLSLADNKLIELQKLREPGWTEGFRRQISFEDNEEKERIEKIRYLTKEERVAFAEDINWALRDTKESNYETTADGYFFVGNGESGINGKNYFADRKSSDVYDSVWVDEVASIVPVIEYLLI